MKKRLRYSGEVTRSLLKNLIKNEGDWWRFLEDPHIPPDNNLIERLLRSLVLKRKVSQRSLSMRRMEDTLMILTVIQTCYLLGRCPATFIEEVLRAQAANKPLPQLFAKESSDINESYAS